MIIRIILLMAEYICLFFKLDEAFSSKKKEELRRIIKQKERPIVVHRKKSFISNQYVEKKWTLLIY